MTRATQDLEGVDVKLNFSWNLVPGSVLSGYSRPDVIIGWIVVKTRPDVYKYGSLGQAGHRRKCENERDTYFVYFDK